MFSPLFSLFRWIREHLRELFLAMVLLQAVIWSPAIIRLYDPTSASMDGAFLQLLFYGGLLFACGLLLTWLALSAAFPTISKWIDYRFKKAWAELPDPTKIYLTLAVTFALLCWSGIALVTAHLFAP